MTAKNKEDAEGGRQAGPATKVKRSASSCSSSSLVGVVVAVDDPVSSAAERALSSENDDDDDDDPFRRADEAGENVFAAWRRRARNPPTFAVFKRDATTTTGREDLVVSDTTDQNKFHAAYAELVMDAFGEELDELRRSSGGRTIDDDDDDENGVLLKTGTFHLVRSSEDSGDGLSFPVNVDILVDALRSGTEVYDDEEKRLMLEL